MSAEALSSVLVANRGEIARRVFRTARAMGLRTVAVYVAADAGAPFVDEADLSTEIDSYLDAAAIVEAATGCGAEAVHPGYGFLSENAGFARAVLDAGLVWVGPSPEVIAAMGDKLEAKRRATAAGVPTLPSTQDPSHADEIGYPLLVKAAAGGGGKGMRVVERPEDLAESVAAARREALSGFGDDTVFLERYVGRSRHVEIQIMGDHHGTVVDHGERECSIQRRHQKIIEEAPAPGIDDDTRAAMAASAVALGRAMGYVSAGTVEFLVDDRTGEYFFLEVNTRLQVEHPVTEESRGIDLVREQFRVAMGQPASVSEATGAHAIEVRLYAEDPAREFLPATGTLDAFAVPGAAGAGGDDGVRWDLAVTAGSVVTIDFDPMIGKVIASGPDRGEAARRLARALEGLHLGGVVTNRHLLVAVLRDETFLAGATTTDYLERVRPSTALEVDDDDLAGVAQVAALWLRGRNRAADTTWGALPAGFRNGRLPPTTVTVALGDRVRTVAYRSERDGSVAMGVGDGDLSGEAIEAVELSSTATVLDWSASHVEVQLGRRRRRHAVTARAAASGPGGNVDRLWVQMPGGTVELVVMPGFVIPGTAGPAGGFVAPMPGKVLEVRAAVGEAVVAGATLVVLEAMKMEHPMTAPTDGVIEAVHVAVGQQVARDEVLLSLRGPDDTGDGTS